MLSAVGHFLGTYDSTYDPQDTAAALARLKLVFKARPTLLIADNLESLLPAGEASLDPGCTHPALGRAVGTGTFGCKGPC